MMAPWWVPRGPRSEGCRSWTSWAPDCAERDGPGAGVAVGVAGVGQDVAERDAAGRASRSAPGPGRGPGRGGRSRRSSAGPARGRAGRAPRASWWRRRGSSRRTARCPGRGRRRSGVPRRLRGRRSRWCRGTGGGRRFPRRSSPRPATVLASLNSSGMDASSRSSQMRCSRGPDGSPSGTSLARASGDQAEGALGLPVGEQVRAVSSSPRGRRASAGRPRAGVTSAWWTRVRWAGRWSASTISMPSSRVRTSSCRARTPMGSSSSIRGAMPERSMMSSRTGSGIMAPGRAEQPDRVGFGGGFQAGEQVAEALGAGDPGGVHERGQARAGPRRRLARWRAAGRCPAGAARSRRPATGSAGW